MTTKILKIKLKYNTSCKECSETLQEGEQVYYDPSSSDYLKITCVDCFEASNEQTEVSEAKKRLSVNDLSTPKSACGNDDCTSLTPTTQFLCKYCNAKLPLVLRNELQLAYNQKLRNKNDKSIRELAQKFRESLPYLEKD